MNIPQLFHELAMVPDIEVVITDALQRLLKCAVVCLAPEQWPMAVAAERYEVRLSRFVKAFQSPGHFDPAYIGQLPHSSPKKA